MILTRLTRVGLDGVLPVFVALPRRRLKVSTRPMTPAIAARRVSLMCRSAALSYRGRSGSEDWRTG